MCASIQPNDFFRLGIKEHIRGIHRLYKVDLKFYLYSLYLYWVYGYNLNQFRSI